MHRVELPTITKVRFKLALSCRASTDLMWSAPTKVFGNSLVWLLNILESNDFACHFSCSVETLSTFLLSVAKKSLRYCSSAKNKRFFFSFYAPS